MVIVDTGPLVALADADDKHHARCVAWLEHARRPLLVPDLVLTEVCYLIERELGPRGEAAFLRGFRSSPFTLAPLVDTDIDRMADLVDQYASLPLGTADASVIATAERLGATEVATLDRRHFTVVRPAHARAFTLLPG